MAHADRETEIKLRLAGVAAGRRLLRAQGFRVARRAALESDILFDTPRRALRRAGAVLRVRQTGRSGRLTYKGPAAVGRHKSREELEVEAAPPATLIQILMRLGYQPVFRYEKRRTEYRKPGGAGLATLDETPIGVFLELEGQPRWIDRTARALGFSPADYITSSYARLYLADCAARGAEPGDMLFARR